MRKILQIKLGWLSVGEQQKLQFALAPFIQRSLLAMGGSWVRDVEVRVPEDYRYVIVELTLPSALADKDARAALWTEAWAAGFASGILVANEIEVTS